MPDQTTHIDIALADPINRMRLQCYAFARKLPEQSERLALNQQLADEIRAAMHESGIAAGSEQALAFDREVEKANAWTKYLTDPSDQPYPGYPNPGTPFEKLLWSNVIMLGTFQSPMKESDGFEAAADQREKRGFDEAKGKRVKDLYEKLANSRPMQQMLMQFCVNTDTSKRGVHPDTSVQYGEPGSWFSCSTATQMNEDGSISEVGAPHVNLDLYFCLVLGDYVETVYEHEMEHAEKTKGMPQFIEEFFVRKVKAGTILRDDPVDIRTDVPMDADKEEVVREYLLANYAYTLAHNFYNSAEDNMCNQGVSDLSDPDTHYPPYPGDMSYGLSVIHTLLGTGETWVNGPSKREKVTAESTFKEIAHAVNEAFFMRNANIESTEENCGKVNIHLESIVDHQTGKTGLDAFHEMEPLCEDIANTQPFPGDRKFTGYEQTAQERAKERNAKVDALFERFGKIEFEKALEEFQQQDLEQQMQCLKEQIEKMKTAKRQGADTGQMPGDKGNQPGEGKGKPGEGSGQGGPGEGEGNQPGQGKGKPGKGSGQGGPGEGEGQGGPGTGKGKGKPQEGGIDATLNGIPIKLPEAPSGCTQGPGNQPGKGMGGIGKPAKWGEQVAKAAEAKNSASSRQEAGSAKKLGVEKGLGLGTEGLALLELGDGRTFAELRNDPIYEMARAKMVNEFLEIARKFRHDGIAYGGNYQLISDRTPPEDLNFNRVVRAGIALGAGSVDEDNYNMFDSVHPSPEATPGEIWLNVDFSGSMGIGIGSDLEVAFKSSAMVWDAAQEAAKIDPTVGKFRVHLMAWGNDVPSRIASPDMEEGEALARIDDVLYKVFNNQHIENLHGGTDGDGALNAIMTDLAHLTSDPQQNFPPEAPVGWLGGLFLSDGDVGLGHSLNNTQDLLRIMPNLTLDAGINTNPGDRETALERYIKDISKRAQANGEDGNRAIHFYLPSGESTGMSYPDALMGWIQDRSDQFLSKRAATRGEVEAQARDACAMLNRPHDGSESYFHRDRALASQAQTENSESLWRKP